MIRLIVELKNLAKQYCTPESNIKLEVLKCINLKIKKKEFIAITGPSGSGKSTLLNIIGTLDKQFSGEIKLFNENLDKLNDKEISILRNKNIGFIFQFHHLLPQFTVLENVMIPTIPLKIDKKEITGYALELLEYVGMKHRLNHRPGELSGGECQRVAFARALINKPQLLLADEPTGCLDDENSKKIIDILIDLNKALHMTLITATHSQYLAKKMQSIYALKNGILENI